MIPGAVVVGILVVGAATILRGESVRRAVVARGRYMRDSSLGTLVVGVGTIRREGKSSRGEDPKDMPWVTGNIRVSVGCRAVRDVVGVLAVIVGACRRLEPVVCPSNDGVPQVPLASLVQAHRVF